MQFQFWQTDTVTKTDGFKSAELSVQFRAASQHLLPTKKSHFSGRSFHGKMKTHIGVLPPGKITLKVPVDYVYESD